MKLFDILKKAQKAEKEVEIAAVRGEIRHQAVDDMLTELYKRVADLEVAVFKNKKGPDKPPKDKDGDPQ